MLFSSYLLFSLSIILSFVLIPTAIRHIGQAGYGVWTIAAGFASYLTLFDLGMGGAIVRYVARVSGDSNDTEQVNRLLSSALAVYCGIAVVVSLAGFVGALVLRSILEIPVEHERVFFWVVVVAALKLAFYFPAAVFANALRGLQRGYVTDLVGSAAVVCTFVLNVLLLRKGLGLMALVLPNLVVGLAQGALWYGLARRYIPGLQVRIRFYHGDWNREIVSFSLYVFLNQLAGMLIFYTDTIVVGAIVGVVGAAVYHLTYRASDLLTQMNFRVADATLPAMAELHGRGKLDRLREVHGEAVRITALVAVPGALLYLFLNEDFVRLWVGSESYGGPPLTLAFTYLIVHHSVLHASAMSLVGAGRMKGIAYMSLVEAGLNLAISVYLARVVGLVGVALGTVVAGVLTSGWYAPYTACRVLGVSWAQYVSRLVLSAIRVGVPFGAVVFAVSRLWRPESLVELFVEGSGLLAVYAVCVVFFGMSRRDRVIYRDRLMSLVR